MEWNCKKWKNDLTPGYWLSAHLCWFGGNSLQLISNLVRPQVPLSITHSNIHRADGKESKDQLKKKNLQANIALALFIDYNHSLLEKLIHLQWLQIRSEEYMESATGVSLLTHNGRCKPILLIWIWWWFWPSQPFSNVTKLYLNLFNHSQCGKVFFPHLFKCWFGQSLLISLPLVPQVLYI